MHETCDMALLTCDMAVENIVTCVTCDIVFFLELDM